MVIIETSVFTRQVQKLLTEDEYKELQHDLSQEQLQVLRKIVEAEYQ